MWGPYDWHMGGFGWGMMIFMMLFWLLFLGGLAFLIVWLVRNYATPARGETPMDILKKRYAQGEISKEEFERMKRDLE